VFRPTTCDPGQTGIFTNVLTAQNGCDSVVVTTINLAPLAECGVEFRLTADTIPCGVSAGTLSIQVLQGQLPLTYSFTGSGGFSGNGVVNTSPFFLQSLPEGQYTLTLALPNGLSATETVALVQATPPIIAAVETSPISCNGAADGAATVLVTGGFPMFAYQWSTGGNSQSIANLGAGTYAVTVSGAYGCSATATLAVDAPPPIELALIVNAPNCFELNDGSVQAEATGGAAPYRYALNESNLQEGNYFDGLSSGIYEITVQDAGGCETVEAFFVNVPVSVEVDLGEDLLIQLGDGAVINAIVNLPDSLLETIIWTTSDTLECPECLTQSVAPLMTTSYSIFVETTDGCSDEDDLTIFVDRRKQIYVPNAFSPNNDGSNDLFFLNARADVVANVRSFSIFSRWGEAVFKVTDFLPNDPVFGWNGTHRGAPLNNAVFVWFAEIEFVDGAVEIFKGDVLLMR
jgi:gliding motility-associated-like protein